MLELSDFDYHLPKNLIAQKPIRPRDHSRLLVVFRRGTANSAQANKNNKIRIEHKRFYDIIDCLHKGDVLALNNSKVMPARLVGKKAETGGRIEVFLLSRFYESGPTALKAVGPLFFTPCKGGLRGFVWNCLLGGHGRKEGLKVEFGKGLKCEVIKNNHDGTWLVKFNKPYKKMMEVVETIGQVPLPPYVKRKESKKARKQESKDYQTIYADDKKIGSVAAPTAGFHFTPKLMNKIKKMGVQIEFITLHVGLGTFAPVKVQDIRKHKMRAEWVEIKKDVARRILKAKKEGRRIVAVGTTSVRALESMYRKCHCERSRLGEAKQSRQDALSEIASSFRGETPRNDNLFIKNFNCLTDIFIYPGYKFKIIDALITNFHLPKSTLLMLVSAFIYDGDGKNKNAPLKSGVRGIKKIYEEAIKNKYRFYSYGDGMFIY